MSRMGKVRCARLGASSEFVPGLHTLGDLDPMRRYINALPAGKKLIWSVGRLSAETRCWVKNVLRCGLQRNGARAGWMAEHMLILVWNRGSAK